MKRGFGSFKHVICGAFCVHWKHFLQRTLGR